MSLSGDDFKLYVSLLMAANRRHPRGSLPTTADLAHVLHEDVETLAGRLAELRRLHFLDGSKRQYRIHDWDEWQPESDANLTPGRAGRNEGKNAVRTPLERVKNGERTHKERIEKRREERDKEKEGDEESHPPRREIFNLYDNYMGKPSITPTMRDILLEAYATYTEECVAHCFTRAAASSDGRRSWSYVESILKRHQVEGCDDRKPERIGVAASQGITAADAATLDRLGVLKPREFYLD